MQLQTACEISRVSFPRDLVFVLEFPLRASVILFDFDFDTHTHGGSIVLIVRGRIFNSACFRRVRASGKGAHVRRRKIKMRKSISMHRERVTSGGRRSRKAARITIFSNAAATTLLQPPPQPSRAQRTNKNRTNIWFDSEWQHYTWLISRFTFAT